MLLFRSDNLLVRHVPGADPDRHVVTFDPWHHRETVDRPGFGETFLHGQGIAATHVLTRGNDWYQYLELPDALAAVRAAAAGARRVMTYGSSMGAYAAIRFADAVGADAALALSPQYSVDMRKTPFEQRWGQVQRRLRFIDAIDGPVACACTPVIVYDPRDIDRLHVARFRAEIAVAEVRVPYASHPATTYLSDAGLLQRIVLDVLDDVFDPAAAERALRARRSASPFYHSILAEAQPPWRPRAALELARRSVALAPDSAAAHHFLALRLRACGAWAEAIAAHVASAVPTRDPALLYEYAVTLMMSGDLPAALRVAREAEAAMPASTDMKHLTVRILTAQADHTAARDLLDEMCRLDPANRLYRRLRRRAAARHLLGRLRGALPSGARTSDPR